MYDLFIQRAADEHYILQDVKPENAMGDMIDMIIIFDRTLEGFDFWKNIHNESRIVVTEWDMYFLLEESLNKIL